MAPPATPDHLSAQAVLVQCLVENPSNYALFLDVDGTLIDIAPTPDSVFVPDALPALVAGLAIALNGALALVSGRTVQELDRLFAPIWLPCGGGHGAQMRLRADGPVVTAPLEAPLTASLKTAIAALADADKRLLFEDKQSSVALHYRAAPERADELRTRVEQIIRETIADSREAPDLIAGKMIYEIKAAGFDKGKAVAQFLQQREFAGRTPIMIGDDTTDESAFARISELNGLSFSVGRELSHVNGVLDNPKAVRMALAQVLTGTLNRILSA